MTQKYFTFGFLVLLLATPFFITNSSVHALDRSTSLNTSTDKVPKQACSAACKGEKGDQGPQGPRGETGLKGEVGPKGEAGSNNVYLDQVETDFVCFDNPIIPKNGEIIGGKDMTPNMSFDVCLQQAKDPPYCSKPNGNGSYSYDILLGSYALYLKNGGRLFAQKIGSSNESPPQGVQTFPYKANMVVVCVKKP